MPGRAFAPFFSDDAIPQENACLNPVMPGRAFAPRIVEVYKGRKVPVSQSRDARESVRAPGAAPGGVSNAHRVSIP